MRPEPNPALRWVRDKLTSTSGTPAFDYELLRQFAQNRQSASMAILLLIATVGFLSGLWTGIVLAGAWTLTVTGIHTILTAHCRKFLNEAPGRVNIGRWRARFVILDLCFFHKKEKAIVGRNFAARFAQFRGCCLSVVDLDFKGMESLSISLQVAR